MRKLNSSQKGFTIIELMIATAVFSVVLLVCAYGLLEIGRTYYRGVTTSRTQEAARRILVEATESIKFNGGIVVANEGAGVHCIGNKRYSFVLNRIYLDTAPNNHALVSDDLSCSTGVTRQNMNAAPTGVNSAEMLAHRMRLVTFRVCPPGDTTACPTDAPPAGSGLYRVTVRVVTGENDLLTDSDGDGRLECRSQRVGSQFCAMSELTTTVRKRVQ